MPTTKIFIVNRFCSSLGVVRYLHVQIIFHSIAVCTYKTTPCVVKRFLLYLRCPLFIGFIVLSPMKYVSSVLRTCTRKVRVNVFLRIIYVFSVAISHLALVLYRNVTTISHTQHCLLVLSISQPKNPSLTHIVDSESPPVSFSAVRLVFRFSSAYPSPDVGLLLRRVAEAILAAIKFKCRTKFTCEDSRFGPGLNLIAD